MKLNEQIIVQKLGKKYVVYDNNHSVLHEFNQVGYLILELIEKGCFKKEIVTQIVRDFDVSKAQATKDLEEFLGALVKKDLITL